MFDANQLNKLARSNILAIAKKRLSVGPIMAKSLPWDDIMTVARDGRWEYVIRPRELSQLFHAALEDAGYCRAEIIGATMSQYNKNEWIKHFDKFEETMLSDGFEVRWAWERLEDSHFAYDGRNNFSTHYESVRNLWHPDGYWGRPTLILRWGKSLQLEDAMRLLQDDPTQDGDFGDDFLTRF